MLELDLQQLLKPLAAVYPDGALPSAAAGGITLQRITTELDLDHDGPDGDGLIRMQISSHGANALQAGALAGQVKALLHGYRNPDLRIYYCWLDNEVPRYQPPGSAYGIAQDYLISIQES